MFDDEGSKLGKGLGDFLSKGLLGLSLFLGRVLGKVSGLVFCFMLSIITSIIIIISITIPRYLRPDNAI